MTADDKAKPFTRDPEATFGWNEPIPDSHSTDPTPVAPREGDARDLWTEVRESYVSNSGSASVPPKRFYNAADVDAARAADSARWEVRERELVAKLDDKEDARRFSHQLYLDTVGDVKGLLDRASAAEAKVSELNQHVEQLCGDVRAVNADNVKLSKAVERTLNCDCLICVSCQEELEQASGLKATGDYDWRPIPRTPLIVKYSKELTARVAALEADLAKASASIVASWRDCHICHHQPEKSPICSACHPSCRGCEIERLKAKLAEVEQERDTLKAQVAGAWSVLGHVYGDCYSDLPAALKDIAARLQKAENPSAGADVAFYMRQVEKWQERGNDKIVADVIRNALILNQSRIAALEAQVAALSAARAPGIAPEAIASLKRWTGAGVVSARPDMWVRWSDLEALLSAPGDAK